MGRRKDKENRVKEANNEICREEEEETRVTRGKNAEHPKRKQERDERRGGSYRSESIPSRENPPIYSFSFKRGEGGD